MLSLNRKFFQGMKQKRQITNCRYFFGYILISMVYVYKARAMPLVQDLPIAMC